MATAVAAAMHGVRSSSSRKTRSFFITSKARWSRALSGGGGGGAPKRPRGTADLLGRDCAEVAWVERQARAAAVLHGFDELRTPIFESTRTFDRTLGEGSDVVRKEMYCLEDRSGNALTLRPEGTAGAARAILAQAGAWSGTGGARVFYCGPMFRYERPQRGRQRQFTQFGIEHIGPAGPAADIGAIALARDVLGRVGLLGETTLLLNTLGDAASRDRYAVLLREHFAGMRESLSPDSQRRLDEGRVLRILDSKAAADRDAVDRAPDPAQAWTPDAAGRFERVLAGLDAMGIAYRLEPRLVRGLDYYSHTVFEFVAPEPDGASAGRPTAVLAGGRYDGLAQALGHAAPAPAVGWAAGIERLVLQRERLGLSGAWAAELPPRVLVAPLLDAAAPEGGASDRIRGHAWALADRLRAIGVPAQLWLPALDAAKPISSPIRKIFREAERSECPVVAIVGEDEARAGEFGANLKHLESGRQARCAGPDEIRAFLAQIEHERDAPPAP